MDRLEKYQNAIKDALTEYARLLMSPPKPDYEAILSLDDERGQYILRRVGWSKAKRIHYTDLHVALRNGKIWIEEDMTEEGIATHLLERGIPHGDIVLGFQPPEMRPHTEFAVA